MVNVHGQLNRIGPAVTTLPDVSKDDWNTHDAFVLIIMADAHLLEKSKAHPRYIASSPARGQSPTTSRIRTFVAVGLCITFFIWHHSIWFHGNQDIAMGDICKQPTPPTLPSNLSRFTAAPGFAREAAKRLAGAVKIPTMFENISPFINASV